MESSSEKVRDFCRRRNGACLVLRGMHHFSCNRKPSITSLFLLILRQFGQPPFKSSAKQERSKAASTKVIYFSKLWFCKQLVIEQRMIEQMKKSMCDILKIYIIHVDWRRGSILKLVPNNASLNSTVALKETVHNNNENSILLQLYLFKRFFLLNCLGSVPVREQWRSGDHHSSGLRPPPYISI